MTGAELDNGLLHIDLARPKIEDHVKTVEIKGPGKNAEKSGETFDLTPEKSG